MARFLAFPELLDEYGEELALLPVPDPELDKLRGELLKLLAGGVALDASRVRSHLESAGLARMVAAIEKVDVSRGRPPTDPEVRRIEAREKIAAFFGSVEQLRVRRAVAEELRSVPADAADAEIDRTVAAMRVEQARTRG